jgi:hypothetical protein
MHSRPMRRRINALLVKKNVNFLTIPVILRIANLRALINEYNLIVIALKERI